MSHRNSVTRSSLIRLSAPALTWLPTLVAAFALLAPADLWAQVPPPPTLVAPGSPSSPGPTINTLTPTMQWNASNGATGYGLYISVYPFGPNNLVYDNDNVPNQTWLVLPGGVLQAGQQYRWNMRARNAAGWSGFSSHLYFQTQAPTGSLRVTIEPQGARDAGARWRVDAGTWQVSGATVSGLSVGTHTVSFNDVAGWTRPGDEQVTIYANQTTQATGSYTYSPPGNAPVITSVEPTDYPSPILGAWCRQSITINGTGFVPVPSIFVTCSDDSKWLDNDQIWFDDSTRIRIAISTGSNADNWSVTVRNPDGRISDPFPFAVIEEIGDLLCPSSDGMCWFNDTKHVLLDCEVVALARDAGFRDEALVTAIAVAYAESGFDQHVYNSTRDYGLWQINVDCHFERSDRPWARYELLSNPARNAQKAWEVSREGRYWDPWRAPWQQYRQYARDIVARCGQGRTGDDSDNDGVPTTAPPTPQPPMLETAPPPDPGRPAAEQPTSSSGDQEREQSPQATLWPVVPMCGFGLTQAILLTMAGLLCARASHRRWRF